ncbi:MAG: hypothetical protein SFU27_01045, partial [Thermonemataceae bacterium]|nr:hypothetical protein [Thermonemataceae bacterium]
MAETVNCNSKDKHLLTKECLIDKLEVYEQAFLMIAHNLRGNLANIQGLLEIYPQEFKNEQQKQLFSYMKEQVDNMSMAMNEIENFIKINTEQDSSSQ